MVIFEHLEEEKPGNVTRALALVARWLAKGSREYRYVGHVLKLEKALLKDILAHVRICIVSRVTFNFLRYSFRNCAI